MKNYLEDQEVYIAYYKDRVIAVSSDKELIHNYMESHRSLDRDQYIIKKEDIPDIDLITKYDDYIITEFHGYHIPNIDQEIISIYSKSIDSELFNTIESLKHIIILSTGVKQLSKKGEEIQSMVNTLKILNKIRNNDKLLKKLNKQENYVCSILYSNIDDYLDGIRRYQDDKMMRNRFSYSMMRD